MNYGNLIIIALRALSNNKLRGFLTMLGIIIGVSSVISMLAIGEGSKRSIEKQIEELGANMIVVNPTNAMVGGIRQNGVIVQTLELKDYQAIMSEVPYLESCSPYVTKSGQAIYGPNNTPTSIYGINEDYMEIRRLSVAKGEMFSDQDMKMAAKVCVVGQTIVDNLFKNGEDPLGQVIRFDKVPFRIVGVLAPKGYNSMGRDQDDIIVAPFTTIQKRLLAIPYMHGIYVSVADKKYTNKVIREITGVLRQTHGISGTQEEDFTVRSLEEMSSVLTMATKVLTILLACIGGISLLVGGIGIMNIMYVSVTERTRGDRFANVHRGQGETYIVPIFDRINHHQCFRWNYRCGLGSRGGISTAFAFGMAGICFIVFRHHFILGLYVYRDILRLVSSPQSFPVKPDRCYSLRVII